LARLYDQRDDSAAAIHHLHAVLGRDPRHSRATSLLSKIERERGAETDFQRSTTPHFVVKWRGAADIHPPHAALRMLEAAHARLQSQLGYRPAERLSVVLYSDQQFR